VTRLARLRPLGRLWPQKVRTRLTLIYALLFLAGGSALLGLTYGLVDASLPSGPQQAGRRVLSHARFATLCTHAHPVPVKIGESRGKTGQQPAAAKSVPSNPKTKILCRQAYRAYRAGLNAVSVSQRDRALHSLLVYSLGGLGLMTVASGAAGWVISGRVLRPVAAITETARRASEQHLGERIGLSGARDELKELADTFDEMLERLDQAFASQRRFVADASHELRTPLTVMRTAIDVTLAKPGRSPRQLEAMGMRVRDSIDRAERMIDALLTLAVSDQGRLATTEQFDLATAADDAIDAQAAAIARLGLRVHADLDPALTTGDPDLLARMVGNLIDNAVRHNEPGGRLTLACGTSDGQAFLRVANTGPLVPPEAVPSLFEPFRRLEGRSGSQAGVGLGLAIARSIAAAHGTAVQAHSLAAGGLEVLVTMPGLGADALRAG